jgi:SAM-dependent methyltransferase
MDPKDIVRQGYDRISYAYRGDAFEPDDPAQQPYVAWIGELIARMPAGGCVLDLGCGNGVPADRLLVDAGYAVHGVDISPVQVARAGAAIPGARYTCADMATVDWPEGAFDAIVCFYALIHVPVAEQPALLERMAHWVRPGGHLLVTVGHRAWTGTEEGWLVDGATMYWSHADEATYLAWLAESGLTVLWARFVPEGDGGHTLVLATKPNAAGPT